MAGKIKDILLAKQAGEALTSHTCAILEAGKGIVGDRYYAAQGTFSDKFKGSPSLELTLIELEQIDAFNITTNLNYSAADFRRNIVTENIDLNALVEKDFYIGSVTLRGIMLCEPCVFLANQLGSEVLEYMTHKAGLRAQIIIGGTITLSDSILINKDSQ
jgi:MOSC domain-containing protein YiiM